jgi:hypothetical protein
LPSGKAVNVQVVNEVSKTDTGFPLPPLRTSPEMGNSSEKALLTDVPTVVAAFHFGNALSLPDTAGHNNIPI